MSVAIIQEPTPGIGKASRCSPSSPPRQRPPKSPVALDRLESPQRRRLAQGFETAWSIQGQHGPEANPCYPAAFARIAGRPQPNWHPFAPEPCGDIVRGIVTTDQSGYAGTISYGSEEGLIWIKVPLARSAHSLSERQALFLLERQSHPSLTRVVYDSEDRTIALLGVAVCSGPAMVEPVIQALIEDLIRELSDDRLYAILGTTLDNQD